MFNIYKKYNIIMPEHNKWIIYIIHLIYYIYSYFFFESWDSLMLKLIFILSYNNNNVYISKISQDFNSWKPKYDLRVDHLLKIF